MVFLGNPEYACDPFPADFSKIAQGCGLESVHIEDALQCGAQLDAVVNRPGPALIKAVVDQYVPPMPAKIKAGQAVKLTEALMRGEPNRLKIVLTNLRDTVREMV